MSLRLAILLCFVPFISGWFCVGFVPGSVISGVSDSITGAEGSHCVGEKVKVGDTIRLAGGQLGTVKSLSGTSSRCTNPEMPIRSLLVLSDSTAASASPSQITSNVRLQLPTGWEQMALTEQQVRNGIFIRGLNRTTDTGLFLGATRRAGITDLMGYAVARRANQANVLIDPEQSEVLQIEVNGRKAFRFEVTGRLKTGMRITYMMTIIEGATEVAMLNTWAAALNFENQRKGLAQLSELIDGL